MKLGKAFSDSLIRENKLHMRPDREGERMWWLGMGRILMFATVLCVALFVLVWRLFDLTIMQGRTYRALAEGNRTRELVRHAPRGILMDRTGKPLVSNTPYYRLLKPCTDARTEDCVVPLTEEEGNLLLDKGLPAGEFLEVDYRRRYLYGDTMSHVVGYTGELTADELDDEYYRLRYYGTGDQIGRTGIEAVFEDSLRGRNGKELVEVDADGTIERTLGRDREIAGEDITLSLDAALQQVVAASFPKGEKGAVVVSKPSTGEILALYSSPTFDLNIFSLGLSENDYQVLLNNPDQPLFDRAIGGIYPPGSTFKIVTALAALEEGAVKRETTVDDVGVLTIGPFQFPNWYFLQYGRTEGNVDIVKAIQRSNDIFFYKAGEWTGITKLALWARKLGIGRPLGIELGGEASGLMPDPAWKRERFSLPSDREARNDEWYTGDTYHVAIGQGYLLVTPIQVNAWTNSIANGGVLCRPTVKKISAGGKSETDCKNLGISKSAIALITEGMRKACEPGGTGWPLFNFSVNKPGILSKDASPSAGVNRIAVPLACKTGTAEFGDPKNHTHAWFTAFAPLRLGYGGQVPLSESESKAVITGDPEISVTVLVEGAGEGSNVAAPIAKKIFEAWFSR